MTTTYRWNQATAAHDYDAAAPEIHPYYDHVQRSLLQRIPFTPKDSLHAVDLGSGSGRLAERLLRDFPRSRVTLVDPSGPFLDLARARLQRAPIEPNRFEFVECKAQEDDWQANAQGADLILSSSALHHLDRHEKDQVFRACRQRLAPGGLFLNGDEYRPASDSAYRAMLIEWGEQMDSALAAGTIPESFREVIINWRRRNLEQFSEPRQSGDDCHETIEEQTARLYGAGFDQVEIAWHEQLWAVLVAR